jgi:hypothetical protein
MRAAPQPNDAIAGGRRAFAPGQVARLDCQNLAILPRQGEVARSDGGGGDGAEVIACLPLRLASASHLPLAGEDCSFGGTQRGQASAKPMPMLARALSDSLLTTG